MPAIEKIGVLGAGVMGGGIAQVCATAGYDVVVYDIDPAAGGTPTKITLCPSTCNTVNTESGNAKVEILLGCKTLVN